MRPREEMRHKRKVKKIGMVTRSQRQSVLANIAKALVLYDKVDTTLARAKAAQRYAERLVTLGRRGDLHARRIAFSRLQDKSTVDKLFNEIAERYESRAGGYTRVVRLGPRKGDGAEQARLMFV